MPDPYRVELSPAAQRQARRLSFDHASRIRQALRKLAGDTRPAGRVKLASFGSVWRIRAGRFRVIYEISDSERRLMVLRIARRNERTYSRLPVNSQRGRAAGARPARPSECPRAVKNPGVASTVASRSRGDHRHQFSRPPFCGRSTVPSGIWNGSDCPPPPSGQTCSTSGKSVRPEA